jgi:hypothetical protein
LSSNNIKCNTTLKAKSSVLVILLECVRALPPVATPSLYLQATGRGYCREGARGQAQFPHQQHSIPPIIASSIPKIPSANLLFQPHPPNTEKTSSLILLQCFREPRQREPHSQCPATFDEGPSIEECLQRRWWSHFSSYSAAEAIPSALGRGWWECSKSWLNFSSWDSGKCYKGVCTYTQYNISISRYIQLI